VEEEVSFERFYHWQVDRLLQSLVSFRRELGSNENLFLFYSSTCACQMS
jgi:hypothetical protein